MTGAELSKRGILNPARGEKVFTLTRHAPSTKLAPLVERVWVVRWDLRGQPPYEQATLPYPCVNVVFGTHRAGLHGVNTERFVAHLDGMGWALGVKFRPGAFRPIWTEPVSALTDRVLSMATAFGVEGGKIDRAVCAATSDEERMALVEGFLEARGRGPDAEAARVADLVGTLEASAITRVDVLAEHARMSVRMLQRLFDEYVGVPPKWVIRRFRVHQAAERVASGSKVDWAALAQELGYVDQAHFIREFKAQVGRTPHDYARVCALARTSSTG